MKTTWWDIKDDRLGWTAEDYQMEKFFGRIGKVKATIYKGYAYVLIYNAKKPTKSIILKSKM